MLDPSCGIGNFLVEILKRRLKNCKDAEDVKQSVKTLYGVELMADNVEECRQRLYDAVIEAFPAILDNYKVNYYIRATIRNRIQWHDSLQFDYQWNSPKTTPCEKHENISFKENKPANHLKKISLQMTNIIRCGIKKNQNSLICL